MNNFIKSLLLFTFMALVMVGCADDPSIPAAGDPQHPEQDVAGTYTGTWTRTTSGTGEVVSFPGTLTLEAASAYITNVSAVCEEAKIDRQSPANIIRQSSGTYRFTNELATNPLGAIFNGAVSADGVATMEFSLSERSGKKTVVNKYQFSGTR